MSVDRSLKTAGNLSRHRNVLTRAERLSRLKNEERWQDGKSVFGLVKVGHRNVKVGKKEKKKEEGTEAVAGAPGAAAPAAAGAKSAAGGKPAAGAKPAVGGKSAAPGKDAKKK